MKLFAINETEWIAANSEEEAKDYSGLNDQEIYSMEEIPEEEWDQEVECESGTELDENDEPLVFKVSIRKMMEVAITTGLPQTIMTDND